MGSAFGQFLQFRFVGLRFLLVLAELRGARRNSVLSLHFWGCTPHFMRRAECAESPSDPRFHFGYSLTPALLVTVPALFWVAAEKRPCVTCAGARHSNLQTSQGGVRRAEVARTSAMEFASHLHSRSLARYAVHRNHMSEKSANQRLARKGRAFVFSTRGSPTLAWNFNIGGYRSILNQRSGPIRCLILDRRRGPWRRRENGSTSESDFS